MASVQPSDQDFRNGNRSTFHALNTSHDLPTIALPEKRSKRKRSGRRRRRLVDLVEGNPTSANVVIDVIVPSSTF